MDSISVPFGGVMLALVGLIRNFLGRVTDLLLVGDGWYTIALLGTITPEACTHRLQRFPTDCQANSL